MKVLLSIIVIIILLLLIRIKLSASYDGKDFIAVVRVLFLKIQLFPGKSKQDDNAESKESKKEKDKQEKEGKGANDNIKQVFDIVKPILSKIRRRLCIEYLKVHITAANDDAVNTALIYGAACTAIGQIFPVLNGNFKIKKYDIKIEPDFTKKNCEITANAVISMAIWEIIYIGAIFLLNMLKDSEKVNKQENQSETESKQIPIGEKDEA